uniref:Uncharacterized protein n=1 Tax=Rhizophora mucronata TaxID=61149 RepID=A0A2P2P6I6_RHIMU
MVTLEAISLFATDDISLDTFNYTFNKKLNVEC